MKQKAAGKKEQKKGAKKNDVTKKQQKGSGQQKARAKRDNQTLKKKQNHHTQPKRTTGRQRATPKPKNPSGIQLVKGKGAIKKAEKGKARRHQKQIRGTTLNKKAQDWPWPQSSRRTTNNKKPRPSQNAPTQQVPLALDQAATSVTCSITNDLASASVQPEYRKRKHEDIEVPRREAEDHKDFLNRPARVRHEQKAVPKRRVAHPDVESDQEKEEEEDDDNEELLSQIELLKERLQKRSKKGSSGQAMKHGGHTAEREVEDTYRPTQTVHTRTVVAPRRTVGEVDRLARLGMNLKKEVRI